MSNQSEQPQQGIEDQQWKLKINNERRPLYEFRRKSKSSY